MKERIPECLAYFKCREKTDCGICLALPVEEWKKHVHKVLKRGEKKNEVQDAR